MPDFCRLHAELECPFCGDKFEAPLSFQWGRVPHDYKLGDEIAWQLRQTGELVPPWKYVRGHRGECFNCGDPMVRDVILLDLNLYDPEVSPSCHKCGQSFDGVAIYIRDARIAECRILKSSDLQSLIGPFEIRPEIIVIGEGGLLCPKPEWNDHVLDTSELIKNKPTK